MGLTLKCRAGLMVSYYSDDTFHNGIDRYSTHLVSAAGHNLCRQVFALWRGVRDDGKRWRVAYFSLSGQGTPKIVGVALPSLAGPSFWRTTIVGAGFLW